MEFTLECPVCKENIESDRTIVIVKCNHLLCHRCAQILYQENTFSCPMCRQVSQALYRTTPHDIDSVAKYYKITPFTNHCNLNKFVYQIWPEQTIVHNDLIILEDDEDLRFWQKFWQC